MITLVAATLMTCYAVTAWGVSVDELFTAYREDESEADRKYKGGDIMVTGTVSSMGSDVIGDPFVVLHAKGYSIFGVQCYISDGPGKEISNLKKGERITVKGKCEGLIGNVILRKCVIVNRVK